jgi:hypothetical protein
MSTASRLAFAPLLLLLFASISAAPSSAQGTCGWAAVPGAPAGSIRALHAHTDAKGHALFVAGDLPHVGNVARFDGAQWSALGAGVDGPVRGLASFEGAAGTKRLIVWGDFTSAGGKVTPGIALWDGSAWLALPHGLPIQPLAVAQAGSGPSARLAVGGHLPGQALWWFDGASWHGVPTLTDTIADLEWFGGRLHAAGVWTLESWSIATAGPVDHVVAEPGHFFPEHLVRVDIGSVSRLHATGTAFHPPLPFSSSVPLGRAVQVLDGTKWSPATPNVAAATNGAWHSVHHLVPFHGPYGPTVALGGFFTHQSGSWIENAGFSYVVRTQHGGVDADVLIPLPQRLDALPEAMAGFQTASGATLVAGGTALTANGHALGNLAALVPCPGVAPAWSPIASCDPTALPLGSPFDQPVLGTTYLVQSDAGPAMLGDAWLAIGFAPKSQAQQGCGLFVPGLGEWHLSALVGDGFMVPSYYAPVGHFSSAARWYLELPALPSLVGLELHLQAIVREFFTGSFSTTRAMRVRLGR